MALGPGPFERARGLLTRIVADRRRGGDFRLPRLTELAAQAGVCHVTMQRALRVLAQQGVVEVRPGRGITLQGSAGKPDIGLAASPVAGGRKWERVRDALRQDTATGLYVRAGHLPPGKVLVERYGANWRTVRKALAALAEEGVIVPDRRGFRPAVHAPRPSRNQLVLIVRGSGPDVVGTWAPRNQEQYRSVEWECAHLGVSLRVVPFWYSGGVLVGPGRRRRLELPPSELDRTLGFMLWTQGLGGLGLQEFLDDLSRHGKPVAVLDSSGDLAEGLRSRAAGFCRLFSVGLSERCGAAVGRYLLSLGHRHLAYVDSPGGLVRLAGLRRVLEGAGAGTRVAVFAPESLPGTQPQPLPDPLVLLRRRVAAGLDKTDLPQELLGRALEALSERIGAEYDAAAGWRSLEPAFERIVARRGEFTAVVAGNDAVALRCLDHLARRKVPVPGQVSLVGFDDTEEALLRNLTSYNFNVPGLMHAMMAYLVHPGALPSRATTVMPVEVEGFVNARRTTAAAR